MDFSKQQLGVLKQALLAIDKATARCDEAQKDLQEKKNALKNALGSTGNDIAALKDEATRVFGSQYLKLDIE